MFVYKEFNLYLKTSEYNSEKKLEFRKENSHLNLKKSRISLKSIDRFSPVKNNAC